MDDVNSLKQSEEGEIGVLVAFKNFSNEQALLIKSHQKKINDEYLSKKLKRVSANSGLNGRYIAPNLRRISLSKADLMVLLADNQLEVYEDKFHKPSLASSVPVIFPNQAASAYLGDGQVVAVLDTGVEKNHSFLTNVVISDAEACFSTENSSLLLESLCPNSVETMIGSGAADACSSSIAGCDHGTQMAGVIAGNGGGFNGVAPLAQIIPVQVNSMSNSEIICGTGNTPCIGARTSDIILGLNYVNSIRNIYSIAAVNLSLSSTITYQGSCDINEPADYIAEIAALVSAGIAVIASSGNEAQANEMSSPACLSDVIAVAATNNSDVPYVLNNRSSELDFFAPGVAVNTSGFPINTFAASTGTSVSAAHVSGAWAVMRSKEQTASLTKIKNAFINTGISVSQGLFSKPRINLTSALELLAAGIQPPLPSPSNGIEFLPAIFFILDD